LTPPTRRRFGAKGFKFPPPEVDGPPNDVPIFNIDFPKAQVSNLLRRKKRAVPEGSNSGDDLDGLKLNGREYTFNMFGEPSLILLR
jgi:hypothetical protein